MMSQELYLAADSGGSKTVWVLLNENGDLIYSYRTHGIASIKEGMLPVSQIVDSVYEQLKSFGNIKAIFLSLGGPNTEEVEKTINRRWSDVSVCVEREACGNAILKAAKFMGCSAVVMCGTGSVAVGDTENGRKYCDGWGPVYADTGSGGGVGTAAIRQFLKHIDGVCDAGQIPKLFNTFVEDLNLSDFSDRMKLKSRIINLERREIAKLANGVYDLAVNGDVASRLLYEYAADEIAKMAEAVSDSKEGNSVLLCGGFFAQKPMLLELCKNKFSESSRSSMKYVPDFAPIIGAQVSVLEKNGVTITKKLFSKILNNSKGI